MTTQNDFINCARNMGIMFTSPIIDDGILHRSHIEGHKSYTKNGAYVIFNNTQYQAGWGMDFLSGIEFTWSSRQMSTPLSLSQRAVIHKAKVDHALAIQNQQAFAAKKANKIWSNSIEASLDNPYLVRKGIDSHGVHTGHIDSSLKDVLIVPVFAPNGELVNLQFIQPDGTKRFLSGGRKKDCFCLLGGYDTDSILIAEGFATAASLHEYTDLRCYIAFDAGNLKSVALMVRQLHPDADIVIAADNDVSGVGQKAAFDAAYAIKGRVKIPLEAGTDWNDVLSNMAGGVQ